MGLQKPYFLLFFNKKEINMTKYEYYKDQYKRIAYPLIDEHQFDELVAEIRADSAERIKELEEKIKSVKKTRRMTYKELDEWLEQGKGIVRIGNHRMSNRISYDCEDRNKEVNDVYKICGWDEDTWHEPLIEVKFGIKDRYQRISETDSFKEAYVDRDIGETLEIKNDL